MWDSLNLNLQTWQPVNFNDSGRIRGYLGIAFTSLNFSKNLKTDQRIKRNLLLRVKIKLSKVIFIFQVKTALENLNVINQSLKNPILNWQGPGEEPG